MQKIKSYKALEVENDLVLVVELRCQEE